MLKYPGSIELYSQNIQKGNILAKGNILNRISKKITSSDIL